MKNTQRGRTESKKGTTDQSKTTAGTAVLPPKVERAEKILRDHFHSLAAESPRVMSEEEQRRNALGDLYDEYCMSRDYVSETLEILATITGNRCDLPNIDSTLDRMIREMSDLREVVEKAFKVGGLPIKDALTEEAA